MNSETVERSIRDEIGKEVAQINNMMRPSLIDAEDDFTRLKLKINNLLWEELPDKITLKQAEIIACEIMSKITSLKG